MTIDPQRDYYAILGVSPAAEDVVIKAAYKALMQRYHPDRASSSKGDTTEKVTEINEAYTILSNAKTRNEYDKLRAAETHSASGDFGVTDTARTDTQTPERAPHGKSKVRGDYKNTGNYAWVLIFGAAVLWKASQTNIEFAIA
jgi:DnaJ-class molecular chaperone